ncbi:MAG: hypothetical protein LBN93_03730 [Candidatus Symbiothrix sp.]|jgi:hypothetical protein|nr:hypothetical protein [Candidatus Symbiothrix sp.]
MKEMKTLPVIFVHKTNSFFLKHVLEQARIFNPDSTIYLLGDETNDKFRKIGIEHYNIADFSEQAKEFSKLYKHQSSNTYDAELFCFQRWFILRDFVTKKGISNFLYLDSDVLLYCNIDTVFKEYLDVDFTIVDHCCPSTVLFKSESLNDFCNFVWNEFYTCIEKDNRNREISDMTAFELYQKYKIPKVRDLTLIENNACFDGNINIAGNFIEDKGLKKIYWIDEKPYAKLKENQQLILLYNLHFQGDVKRQMYNYRINFKHKHVAGIFYRLRSELSLDLVIRVFKRYLSKIAVK